MPDNFVSFVLFVAFITPGYVWIRLEERARPRPDRSGILEVAELLTIGVLASFAAAAFVGWLGTRVSGLFDVPSWAKAQRPSEYLAAHAINAGSSVLVAVLVANLGVLVAAGSWFGEPGRRVRNWWRQRPGISAGKSAYTPLRIGSSVWFDVLGDLEKNQRRVFLTVVQDDGTVLDGYLRSYVYDAHGEDQDIALQPPLHWRPPGGERAVLSTAHAVVPGRSIRAVYAVLEDLPEHLRGNR